jgi:hypothetical protein
MVDRYGVTRGNEQYKGFAQLPEAKMDVDSAVQFLAQHAGVPPSDIMTWPSAYRDAYRAAARKLHPDAGGSHELFLTLGRAQSVLNQLHGL